MTYFDRISFTDGNDLVDFKDVNGEISVKMDHVELALANPKFPDHGIRDWMVVASAGGDVLYTGEVYNVTEKQGFSSDKAVYQAVPAVLDNP